MCNFETANKSDLEKQRSFCLQKCVRHICVMEYSAKNGWKNVCSEITTDQDTNGS